MEEEEEGEEKVSRSGGEGGRGIKLIFKKKTKIFGA